MMLRRYHKKSHGFGVPIETVHPRSLNVYTVKELREMCKRKGLKGYSNKTEAELIEMLRGGDEDVDTDK